MKLLLTFLRYQTLKCQKPILTRAINSLSTGMEIVRNSTNFADLWWNSRKREYLILSYSSAKFRLNENSEMSAEHVEHFRCKQQVKITITVITFPF